MAYKAEIAVNVRGLKDVKTLETSLNKISGKISAINKISIGNSKAAKIEEKVAKSKEAQRVSMIQTRRVGDAVQRGADKGLQTEKALAAVKRAAKADAQGQLKVSEAQRKIALEELKVNQGLTQEKVKQVNLQRQMASPIGGIKTMMGSPAQQAFSGGPSSSILGSKTTFGSPKFFDAAAKAGGPSIPVKGSKDIYGSPAYYAATNKEAKRVAKANAVPIKGFKDLPGSPAYFEEQARNARSSALNFDKRTGKLLRGPAGSGGGGFRNLARRFDTQSALISGGFPLLFGQGPAVAAAGALGGGIGGMFGQMGGFAGGIAATAAVQAIQSALDEISKLGQAMGAFTQDTKAITAAMGLQGSAQEAQLNLIEKTQGKTAAFNAAIKMMENRIGTGGVRKIREFGETTRVLGTIFSTTLLRLQAFMAGMANFIAKLVAGEKQFKEAKIDQTIKDAAAAGNVDAQALLDRESEIAKTGFRVKAATSVRDSGGNTLAARTIALPGTEEKIKQLERDKELFVIRNKIDLANAEILEKSAQLVQTTTDELDLQKRIKEEISKGRNEELAKSIAKVNQVFDAEQKVLQSKVDQAQLDLDNVDKDKIKEKELQKIKDILEANKEALKDHNELREKAIKLEEDLALATDALKTNFEIIGESIASGVTDNITAAIQGTKSLGDAAKSILNDLSSSLIRLGVNTLLSKIPGFGGLPTLLPRANGGPVKRGGSFLVGEKGPELFVPRKSGMIIPNDKLAGGGSTNINVNVDATGSSVQSNEQQGKELGRVISAAIQSELIKQRRPGGLLR